MFGCWMWFWSYCTYLTKAGLSTKQIMGVDLSSEMIRNAQEQHPGISFEAADFIKYKDEDGFEVIIFCSALHDFLTWHQYK